MVSKNSDITLSRIRPPVLPANFLSRRHLFELIDDRAPGYTMVVAPAGYGKTSLLAEWATQSKKKVIWYTMSETDSSEGIAHYLVSAIRQVFPNFGLELNSNSVTSVFQEISNLKEDVVLILDNVVDSFTYQLNATQSYMDAIPDNVHIFAVRRLMPTVSLQRFSRIGRLSIITAGDLVFSKSEISNLISINGGKVSEAKLVEIANQTHGWPSAVAIIATGEESKFDLDVDDNLVKELIASKFEKLSEPTKETLLAMSSFEVFDANAANALLKKPVNEAALNKLASEGVFLMPAAGQINSFIFNNSAREVIDEIARSDSKRYQENQKLASEYFGLKGEINNSISYALKSGDSDYLRKMFKPALRKMVNTGEGRNILYWSRFLPLDSTRNKLFAEVTKAMGHLVSFDFERAVQLSEELRFTYKESELNGFVNQVSAITLAHVAFCRGRLSDFDRNMEIVLAKPEPVPSIDPSDRLGLLRLIASRFFIFDDAEKLKCVYSEALEFSGSSSLEDLSNLQSIKAMKLFLDGEYLLAFEAATLSEEISDKNDFYGVSARGEAIYIKARCYLEFSEPEKADLEFSRLAVSAREWQQWPWVFMAEGYLSRSKILRGDVEEAFAVLGEHRTLASTFKGEDGFSLIIDLNELFLRFWVRDYERTSQILNRLPKDLLFANRYRTALSAATKGEVKQKDVPVILPTDSAREQIWKSIVGCTANIEQESLALDSLKLALEIGARVGAKETFLRQDPKVLELIIRSASKTPTVYLEELARAAAHRMRGRNSHQTNVSEPLTKREIDVLRSLASGKPITSIGKNLHISQNTMKTHLRNIYRKLSVNGREEAVKKAQGLYII